MRTVNRPESTPRLLLVVTLLSAFLAPACHKESPTGTDEQSAPPSEILAIDAHTRRSVVAALAGSLRENYFDVRAAEVMATKIKSRLAEGDYDAIDDAHSFAVRLEKDLHAISDDRHLLVTFCARPAKPARPQCFDNHGFAHVELHDGDIGHVEILTMAGDPGARHAAAEAMARLSEARALILDLRKNRGGAASMADFLCSHLFETRTLLYTLKRRSDEKTEVWTSPEGLGHRFSGDVSVFVLVSGETFSAAEGLAYVLQQHGRAKIVGETTKGGAHPNMVRALPTDFMTSIPFMRVVHPVSGGDWEGVGVRPDVQCASNDALTTALSLARGSLR
ncbi:MAG: S41 family peptidase [Candidatus Nealsonbacteria bacterium]|nr:S41 family peptidase [Candidatus Nealsonbacteria bacterium]